MQYKIPFKRILSLTLCTITTGLALQGQPAGAYTNGQPLRIALSAPSGKEIASSFPEPMLENVEGEPTGFQVGAIIETNNGETFSSILELPQSKITLHLVDDAFQVCDGDSGDILYTSDYNMEHLMICPNSSLTWFKGYKWHGNFLYKRAKENKLSIINYVDLEDYVKGVLPYEVDPDWHLEALKAQAVCSRSFAICTNKHQADGYDLCNTTCCQVYYGANTATEQSNKAVDATQGEYLTYNGTAVEGNFFSSDGGATEDAENVWGGESNYLLGKVDPYEKQSESWSVTLTAEEIQKKLQAAEYNLGSIANVVVTKRTPMDNVNEVVITDTAGTKVTLKQSNVRTVFQLHSIRYTITPNYATKSAALPRDVKIQPSTHKVTVDGSTVAPQGYNIDGYNYYKLRDIAYLLNGTDSQFNIEWSPKTNQITLIPQSAYESVGGELTQSHAVQIHSYTASNAPVFRNDDALSLAGYCINNNNYYKLRDLGEALGFGVEFDGDAQTVMITSAGDTSSENQIQETGGSTPQTTAIPLSYTFTGTGWGHSVGLSQWGAHAMAESGFSYRDILKFYYTGIEIAH